MFLQFLRQYNPRLINCAADFLKKGLIQPDSYVLDLDAIETNADRILRSAREHGVSLYFMSKQIGRNPLVSRRVLSRRIADEPLGSFAGMVAVDYREALSLHNAGLTVSHVGHLVQIPDRLIDPVLDMRPQVITVYSLEKARTLGGQARAKGLVQPVLLRICDEGNSTYPGQEGGFSPHEAVEAAAAINLIEGLRFAGITSFPCFLQEKTGGKAAPTPNAYTLVQTEALIRKCLNLRCVQINMPSCTSPETIPQIAGMGGTHGEPGHSLTGTNPDNIQSRDPLIPGLVYVTEVSHHYRGFSSCYGGGHYRRSHIREALIGSDDSYETAEVLPPTAEAIDYHFSLPGIFPIGMPVLMSFRTQIFVTRSCVVPVEGISAGMPRITGIWDSQGRRLSPGEIR
ncbi:MAG: alanine racemase [Treponema sp.]|nr:alanine racemase [Treponema sp.]